MLPSTTTTTTTTRRLLRGEITYSAAKEIEANVLHSLSYWDQQSSYFEVLRRKSQLLETVVAHHLKLVPTSCRIAEPSKWLSGTFVCIPIYENVNLGNADEKLLCEIGTYTWLQHNCPGVPIPQLHEYGLSTGQNFTALENLPFLTRSVEAVRRHILRFLGFPVPFKYVAHNSNSGNLLGVRYLLIDYIDVSRGRMLSASWNQGRHDPRLRMYLFRSLSDIMLVITRTPLPKIGSFIVDEKGCLRLRNRPLTLEIQDLENQHVPVDIPRDFTYSTIDSYVSDILAFHESRLRHQLNAVNNVQDDLFQMAGLTVMRAVRNLFFRPGLRRGTFYMSLTDLHQSNIFVNDDWNIRYLVDLEWACSPPAEMIHPPYRLTNQSVDAIDFDAYKSLHREFMQAFAEQISKRSWQHRNQIYSILQEGRNKGTYCIFQITMDYLTLNAARFIQEKVKDKEKYDRLLLEAFEQAPTDQMPMHE
ncbi:hypothetical protein BO86DRAFT_449463 [Aspergillus japonicus CBS 114.51]|uniref:Aminoglycoside phosphotransferase domain-containing protein n=1 Tax=Aspergillus japonicus CBS 114.51 TaxID=1448312 RepID=A0A8T8WVZ0_ASPJA|nr:hypothetical protein BO86DRAFT_449463 [Aspergillus japonicus CBS 114.51]RAH79844.1 hypothetical protein BO86DRAFT_449463 [Aspergillus japonicus CBS 114.51]